MTAGLDPSCLDELTNRRLLLGSVIPRPIAWTSTVSAEGIRNLAPFSFFTVISGAPPMVSLTIEPRSGGGSKDTLANIRATGEFVINVVTSAQADAMWRSSAESAPTEDEFTAAGVATAPSVSVLPPRVLDSPLSMECVCVDVIRPGSDDVVLGRIVRFHIDERVVDGAGHVDPLALNIVGRVGGRFIDVDRVVELPRGGAR